MRHAIFRLNHKLVNQFVADEAAGKLKYNIQEED
jgi:hypothetical protein